MRQLIAFVRCAPPGARFVWRSGFSHDESLGAAAALNLNRSVKAIIPNGEFGVELACGVGAMGLGRIDSSRWGCYHAPIPLEYTLRAVRLSHCKLADDTSTDENDAAYSTMCAAVLARNIHRLRDGLLLIEHSL